MRLSSRSGFTLVELAVTIAVIALLVGIAGFATAGFREESRDDERRTKVSNIATFLDGAYTSGFTGLGDMRGSYPSTNHITSNGIDSVFRGFDQENLKAPDSESTSLVVATNSQQTPTGVRPRPTINTYVYQPLRSNGGLCTYVSHECRKFNIFYKLENVDDIQKVTSKNQ